MKILQSNFAVFAATTTAAHLMNSVYQFYYVNLFLNHYKISTFWFNFAQIVYMIWNAVNDPLFGYFQDNSNLDCLKHRRLNILYGAPLFVLSFLLPWFGWASQDSPQWVVGMHLLISLAAYDCMFTFVLLAQCSLFTEVSRNQKDRQTLMMYSQVAAIIGSSAVIVTEVTSNHMKDLRAFQLTCVFIALISWWLMNYTGRNIKVSVDRSSVDENNGSNSWASACNTCFQIFTNRNFVTFVLMNFCQVFHSTYCANFFSIFRNHLIGEDGLPSIVLSLVSGSAFILPSLVVLASMPFLKKHGSYALIQASFVAKIVLGLMLFMSGYHSPWLVALFMVLDSALVGASFSLFNLSLSDIIDDDQIRMKRSHPISSMVFGVNALVTKPAQSLAPMFIVHTLNLSSQSQLTAQPSDRYLKEKIFHLMVSISIVIGCVQFIVWSLYKLRKTHESDSNVL